MPERFKELAAYNTDRARGILFDDATTERMAALQREFDAYSRAWFIQEHPNHDIVENNLGIAAFPRDHRTGEQ